MPIVATVLVAVLVAGLASVLVAVFVAVLAALLAAVMVGSGARHCHAFCVNPDWGPCCEASLLLGTQ